MSSSYQEFVSDLADREFFGQKLGLERIQEFLGKLNNPHLQYPTVHIAGTNGKGSTAAMTAEVLRQAGYRVGLYTSPHLEDFCERIQVDGHPISRESVMAMAKAFKKMPSNALTFFEFTTALAFDYFARKKVDIAIIEVGLGGRLDATNVVQPLVSVITSIGLDHQEHLGNTFEKIAYEKAGIIKSQVPVVYGNLPESAEVVVKKVAAEKGARLVKVRRLSNRLGLAGKHQQVNAAMVIEVIRLLNQSGKFKVCPEDVEKGLVQTIWPARLETLSEKPWILLDGAHNVEAMEKACEYLESQKQGRKVTALLGIMSDKDAPGLLKLVDKVADKFVFTQVNTKRAMTPEELQKELKRISSQKNSFCVKTVSDALTSILSETAPNDILFITGSFYIVGEARTWLKKWLEKSPLVSS